jgi:hypothetical protein
MSKVKSKELAVIHHEDMSGWKLPMVFEALEAAGKYTRFTIRNYRCALKRFCAFHSPEVTAEKVSFAMLEEFRHHREQTVSAKSANHDIDAISAIVKFANPKLLKERYRGNIAKLHHIRIDIADSGSAKHPRRLEKIVAAMMKVIHEEGGGS